MAEIYVIEGNKTVMLKIRDPIPLIRRGQKKLLYFLNNFLKMNYFKTHHFFSYIILTFNVIRYIFSDMIENVLHSWKEIK